MAKKNLHPQWHLMKVYCDGSLILEIGGTKKELHVDIWSGNHPLYTGNQKSINSKGRTESFEKRYNFFNN